MNEYEKTQAKVGRSCRESQGALPPALYFPSSRSSFNAAEMSVQSLNLNCEPGYNITFEAPKMLQPTDLVTGWIFTVVDTITICIFILCRAKIRTRPTDALKVDHLPATAGSAEMYSR